jgi:hypothetical protein
MSDTQNTYSSSNLYPFLNWSTASNGNGGTVDERYSFLSEDAKKRLKLLVDEIPKKLEEANKSYLGLTRRYN